MRSASANPKPSPGSVAKDDAASSAFSSERSVLSRASGCDSCASARVLSSEERGADALAFKLSLLSLPSLLSWPSCAVMLSIVLQFFGGEADRVKSCISWMWVK